MDSQLTLALNYLKFIGEVLALLGFVGTLMVFCAKGILAFGELRTSLKRAIGFCERFESSFSIYQEDTRQVHDDFRDRFAEIDSQLKVINFALDLDGRAQDYITSERARKHQDERRHIDARRAQDGVNRDVRRMIDLNTPDDA